MKKIFLLILFGLLSSTVYAGTIDPNTPDEKYLEYGSKFDSIVRITLFDGVGNSNGSAVIIDKNWVLTAAHVVSDKGECSIILRDKQFKIDKVICHPKYEHHVFGWYDIALCHTVDQIDLDCFPKLYSDFDEEGKVCSMAGFGNTGTFVTGAKKVDFKKRGGSNFVDKIDRGTLVCTPSRRNQKMTELEFLIAPGDSGGGLFIDGKLAGIHTSVIGYDGKSDSTYGDESCHTRISLYHDWILENMSK